MRVEMSGEMSSTLQMYRGVLREGVPVKCRAVLAYHGTVALRRRCELLGISRSAFYAWCRRPPSRRAHANTRLVREMERIHLEVDRSYGSPRMREIRSPPLRDHRFGVLRQYTSYTNCCRHWPIR